MDMLSENVKRIYFKYLTAAFGSALISSIYGIVDMAMGFLTMIFNRQIVRYFGTDALSVYGVIVNVSTIVQCCAYSVGQAAQPILSVSYGAHDWERIKGTLRYALYTVAFFSIAWTISIWAVPNGFIRVFMAPTEAVFRIAPSIMRSYGMLWQEPVLYGLPCRLQSCWWQLLLLF